MSIIKLKEPWCFNIGDLTEDEIEELYSHFVSEENYHYLWSHADPGSHVGIDWRGTSNYFGNIESFDEYDIEDNVTIYTIEQLRAIIAEHLAKQHVEPESVTKFVVGKWYKWFQKDHGREQKGKCATLYDSHFEMKPWICHSSEYVENGMFNLRDAESIEIIEDLSEIQDLLPDGHEDKQAKVYFDDEGRPLKEFKVGSWYTNPKYTPRKLSNGNSVCFFKVKSCVRKGSSRDYYYNQFKFDEVADKYWNKEIASLVQSNTDLDQEMVEVFPVVKSETITTEATCETCNGEGTVMVAKLYPSGHTEVDEDCPDCDGNGFIEEKVAPKSERYLATMKFFEQLREPERSEAIANYDEDYGSGTKVPKDLAEAINYGFEWSSTKQEHEYWMVIKDEIMSGIYFQEEILVFGKYKIGDIVVLQVCTDRYPMFKVSKDSTPDKMVDETGAHSTNPGSFRPATSEEVEAYNQGVKNVADIKPKDYKEAVHCTTQEEWDFVLSKNKFKGTCSSSWTQHKKDTYMDLHHGSFGDVNGTGKDWGYTILTFKQWCEKYGHSYEVVIEYVECVNSTSHHYKEGKIYTWPDTITEEGKPNKPDILKGGVWEFKPSTKEAYDEQQEKLKMEELLNEAKRRYPTGTKVRAVLDGPELTTEIFTLTDSHYWASGSKVPACYTEEGHPVCLHLSGKWAEIVKEEPKPTEIKPAKGMHVRCLKENNWSDGKTKVGQVFEIESVDWIGDMWVNNHSFAKERLGRGEFELLTDYKEEPWIAQVGDWVYVLENCAYGGVLNKGEIVKCIKYDTISQQFKEEGCTWLRPKDYRKATQEEIDSVTKSTVTNTLEEMFKVGDNVIVHEWHFHDITEYLPVKGVIIHKSTNPDSPSPYQIKLEKKVFKGDDTWWFKEKEFTLDDSIEFEWTADNWYVEVSSQEEADAVIDAAAKMYGEPYDKYFAFNDEWKYVGLCHKNKDYTLLSRKFIHVAAKPRLITDFIQPEKPTLFETVKKTFFDKPTQQATPDDSYIFAGEVTEEEFNEIKRLCKPQQDELVIYKPKQTRLVEPGAISASVSTTNLIIKSNSKYL